MADSWNPIAGDRVFPSEMIYLMYLLQHGYPPFGAHNSKSWGRLKDKGQGGLGEDHLVQASKLGI